MRGRRQGGVAFWVLLGLLAAVVVWVVRLGDRRAQEPAPQSFGPAPGLRPVSFELRSPDDTIAIRRTEDGFVVTRPVRDRADPRFMAEFTRELKSLKPRRTLPDTVPERYGLLRPRRAITLEGERGEVWGIAVGDSSPVGSGVYAREMRPGAPVVLLETFPVRKYLLADLTVMRDRVPARLGPGPVDSVAVLSPRRPFRAVRENRELWLTTTDPRGLRIDPLLMNQVLTALRGPEIRSFVQAETPGAELGLDPPRARWILFQGGRRDTVLVGHATANGKSVYVVPAGRSTPALLETGFYRGLVDGWPAFADKHLVGIPADSVTAVEVADAAGGFSYRKKHGQWVDEGTGAAAKHGEALSRDLENLILTQWSEYPAEEPAPVRPAPRVRIVLRTEARAESLHLATSADGAALAWSTARRRWGPVSSTFWRTWSYRAAHRY